MRFAVEGELDRQRLFQHRPLGLMPADESAEASPADQGLGDSRMSRPELQRDDRHIGFEYRSGAFELPTDGMGSTECHDAR